MAQLLRANQELFRRTPDECFDSLDWLVAHCQRQKDESQDRWKPAVDFAAIVGLKGRLSLSILLRGVSTRSYQEVLPEMAETVGVSKSQVSRENIEVGERLLTEISHMG